MIQRMIALLLAGVLGSSQDASAQAFMPELDPLIDRLDAESLSEREEACAALRAHLGDDGNEDSRNAVRALESRIAERLRGEDLSLEQRVRLMDVLRDRFATTPRGAMGVAFAQQVRYPLGVELQDVIDGFPAKEKGLLKPGDVVVQVAGVSLIDPELAAFRQSSFNGSQELLRSVVVSHDVGETVQFEILRPIPRGQDAEKPLGGNPMPPSVNQIITEGPGKNFERLEIALPLGSFENLRQGVAATPYDVLDSAWKVRMERLRIPQVPATSLSIPMSARDWQALQRSIVVHQTSLLTPSNRAVGAAEFGALGVQDIAQAQVARIQVNRNAVHDAAIQRAARMAQQRLLIGDGQPGKPKLPQQAGKLQVRLDPPPHVQPNQIVQELAQIMQEIATLSQQRDQLLVDAANVTRPDLERRASADAAAMLATRIKELEGLIAARIEAAGAEPKDAP